MMDLAAFEDRLDRFGGDLSAWPAADVAAARSLLARAPEVRAALAAAQEIEALLRTQRPAPAAFDVVAQRAMAHRQDRRRPATVRRLGWAAAAATVLLLGVYVGGFAALPHEEAPDALLASDTDMLSPIDVD